MPLDYLQYQQGVRRPLEMAVAGYQAGSEIRRGQEKQQVLDLQKTQAVQMQADLATLSAKPQATAQDYASMMVKYPTMSEHFKTTFDMLSTEQQKVKQSQAVNLFSALDAGQTDIAEKMLAEQKVAAENSGLTREAQSADALLQLVQTNPEAAKTASGLLLSSTMGSEKFAETWTKLQAEQRERELLPISVKKSAADLGLTAAQTKSALIDAEKTGLEAQKAILELEALKKSGGVDPKKKFDQEEKLRKEYTKRTEDFSSAERNFDIIKSSAVDKSGAGDIALVTTFMKMLDPGSVVRETEFATARDTSGLLDKLKNSAQKIQDGQFLSVSQRMSFMKLAEKYLKAARTQEKGVRKNLRLVVDNYGLNSENVFGVEKPDTLTEVVTPPTPDKSYMRHAKGSNNG